LRSKLESTPSRKEVLMTEKKFVSIALDHLIGEETIQEIFTQEELDHRIEQFLNYVHAHYYEVEFIERNGNHND
jgi:hypothetical protein